MPFKNRKDAARQLFRLVKQYEDEIDIVLAIPRGGVEVAAELADKFRKPLGLINARKISSPHNPEVAIGAVAPDGSRWFNQDISSRFDKSTLERQAKKALSELRVRQQDFGEVELSNLHGRGVLVVDDGAATGATLMACVEALRRAGAHPVGAAAPVAAIEVVSIMEDVADYFLAAETPSDLLAVSEYYQDFGEVSNQTVKKLVQEHQS